MEGVMLADPQSVTIGATTSSLPRIGEAPGYADYNSADGTVTLRTTQNKNGTTKRVSAIIRQSKIAADPLTAVNQRLTSTVTISFQSPLDGFSTTELKDIYTGLTGQLNASSSAVLLKLLGGEK
jgi:hypothetical protein